MHANEEEERERKKNDLSVAEYCHYLFTTAAQSKNPAVDPFAGSPSSSQLAL